MFQLRRHGFILLVGSAALLCAAGCHGKRKRVRRDVQKSYQAWYRQAWGHPPGKAQIEASNKRFDCLWREVSRAGGDPAKDLECFARRLDAVAACYGSYAKNGDKAVHLCGSAFKSACSVSAAFQRAASSTCKAHSRAAGAR